MTLLPAECPVQIFDIYCPFPAVPWIINICNHAGRMFPRIFSAFKFFQALPIRRFLARWLYSRTLLHIIAFFLPCESRMRDSCGRYFKGVFSLRQKNTCALCACSAIFMFNLFNLYIAFTFTHTIFFYACSSLHGNLNAFFDIMALFWWRCLFCEHHIHRVYFLLLTTNRACRRIENPWDPVLTVSRCSLIHATHWHALFACMCGHVGDARDSSILRLLKKRVTTFFC